MIAALLWIGLTAPALHLGLPERPGPLAWSPDGRWLAYVHEAGAAPPPLPPGWLFQTDPEAGAATPPPPAPRPVTYRLWASRPEAGEHTLLEESRGPLSAPCWNRDGSGLCFGRVGRDSDGSPRWEVVVQDAPDRRRVILSEPIAAGSVPPADAIRVLAPAWSGDGRIIAAPTLSPPGLALIRADSGRLLRTIEGASSPAWAPLDARLAYARTGLQSGIYVLDTPAAEPRRVADAPAANDRLPGPSWTRDGESVYSFRRVLQARTPGAASVRLDTIQLVRSRADSGQVESGADLVHDPIGQEGTIAGAWYSADPETDDIYYSAAMPGKRLARLTHAKVPPGPVLKPFNPFEETCLPGALAARPGGRGLALRVWSAGGWSPPALCDPVSERLTPLAPDADARDDWRLRIVTTLAAMLRDRLPASPSLSDGRATARPSLLPCPGELEPGDPTGSRLKHLARLGLPLLDPASPEPEDSRLALAYLADDAPAALDAIDGLLSRAETPRMRLRLLSVRAQTLVIRRDFDRARPLIEYLRRASIGPSHMVEDGVTHGRLSPVSDPHASWPAFLAEKLNALKKAPPDPGGGDIVPSRALNLDGLSPPGNAPAPGVRF